MRSGTPDWVISSSVPTETAFSVAYEPLQGSDPLTIARAMQIAVREGWASRETAARELGFDYAAERQRAAGENIEPPRRQETETDKRGF